MSKSERFFQTNYSSPLGDISIASDGENIVGLWLDGQKYFQETIREEMIFREDLPVFAVAKDWLNGYFAGEKMDIIGLPLAPAGSEFRQEVWKILCEIPYGKMITYGEIAHRIADKRKISRMSAQAVGGAVGHNPISIMIPCHRVIGVNGNLTGYGGGIDKKIKLLELEGVDVSCLKMPESGKYITE